jgi:hypothetical protein
MSVRITAAGAVAVALLSFLTAPVSACDERFIKKCERASAAAVATEEQATPATKHKSAGRVHVIVSRRSRQLRFAQRVRAPRFASHGGMVLASAESRMTIAPDTPLARRFRGFIDPQPIAQNAFETLRKPHIVAVNLEPPLSLPAEAAPVVAETPAEAQAPVAVVAAKQDRVAPAPGIELASAASKAVTLNEPAAAKPAPIVTANAVPPVPQAFMSEAPPAPVDQPQPSRFSIHQLVIALCGALGAASALRFIVGA